MFHRKLYIAILVLFASCSTNDDGTDGNTSTQPAYDIVNPEYVDKLIDIINTNKDLKYQKDCIREVYYYCPPLTEIHRAKAFIDICKDNTVVSINDCEEVLECIPTNGVVDVVECVDENGVNGFQNVYCYKGFYEYGKCNPCQEEVCDGKDNDCDGEIDEGVTNECGTCGEIEEICDYIDNDCDGEIDEGVANACGDCEKIPDEICNGLDDNCDGQIDEGQLNACGVCGPLADEVCDGIDNDCNGKIDENLIDVCSTDCEQNLQFCVGGSWICTAKLPQAEICNGLDDDCDGQIDENLDCLCTINDIGKLIPCKEDPLKCGEGFKTCECIDEDCTDIQLSECFAVCHWLPQIVPPGSTCDKFLGEIKPEECNNHDDNCNDLVDEDLTALCYSAAPETMYVGICLPGEIMCFEGAWGNYDDNGDFIKKLCLGEVTPEPEDICNGTDTNCDGVIDEDKKLEPTDILFIIDLSGSMIEEINAVTTALNQFATYYSDSEVIKWGLVFTAASGFGLYPNDEKVVLQTDLVDFETFMTIFAGTTLNLSGGDEQNYDALYLSIHNLVSAAMLPYPLSDLEWKVPGWSSTTESIPPAVDWDISWRDDAKHVVILFSDEIGQTFLTPQITETILVDMINAADDLAVYAFTSKWITDWSVGNNNYEALTLAGAVGKLYELTSSAVTMYANLLEILNETACAGE